jgi:23S rRNA-/tRNA-specific pseudouridylate synthase
MKSISRRKDRAVQTAERLFPSSDVGVGDTGARDRLEVALPDGSLLRERVVLDADGVLVINKPPRLPTAGRSLEDTDCLQWHLMQATRRMVWAVHQLDADTSGVNVFVRRRTLVPVWQQAMAQPTASKRYVCWLHGELAPDEVVVDAPIGQVDGPRFRWGVTPDGRPARSVFRVIERVPGFTLASVRIFTGRTHQIRVHAASLGHSLVGEEWYRPTPCTLHDRQALHALSLDVQVEGVQMALQAPVAADLLELHQRLGFMPWQQAHVEAPRGPDSG